MKPLGKCMKSAYSTGADRERALDDLIAAYRATPHSSTGVAPGDILFRHGYTSTFPKVHIPDDQEIEEAREQEQCRRRNRDDEKNENRLSKDFQIGDTVFTHNYGHTKFQPAYGPNPTTVVSIGDGGVVCKDSTGVTQRRHADDIKLAPSKSTSTDTSITPAAAPEDPSIPLGEGRPRRHKKAPSRYQDYIMN